MNQVQAVKRLNEQVLALGEAAGSWHDQVRPALLIAMTASVHLEHGVR